jgi:hypothetical protein
MDIIKGTGIIALVACIISLIPAYITHVVWWVRLLMNNEMDTVGEGFLALAGMIFPPIGIIHGYTLWFS